ncbi:hypothetical protein [Siminovitchia fordii]|uniref:Uncharacterized protein n=1 Tax=Siminovitchia fordii TaxID=254759 RepID=A0ABQ4KC72_9BACI|nr:hypothetical protein [Siminovitchia fordii]GIN23326.1 hypothetical protein J1TS3_44600 [Siminovitchia fordii]
MKDEQNQKLRSITFTCGTIKKISTTYELLKIRGSVAFHQDIHTNKISTHGHSSFQHDVVADVLKNSGSCVLKNNCDIKEIVNTGNIKIKKGQTTKINSSGKLTVEEIIQSENVDLIGIVQAKEIKTKKFQLKLSGESVIERLIADEAYVEKEKVTFSLLRKKLFCKYIKGGSLQISYTDAEIVEGDTVVIGKNCNIQNFIIEKVIQSPQTLKSNIS